jgi:FAD/FMN-containing dehydrogenase
MASTNAGGLRTVRYGNMGEQIIGLDIALADGSLVHRHSRVRMDNTGYDLASLFVGAEGTLGVITGLDLRLHPTPTNRVTAICGFADLDALIETGRTFRDIDGIAALELIDARASALTAEHVGVAAPVAGAWQLLIELAGDTDQTERLADALEDSALAAEPAVGVDVAAQQRLWQVREAVAEVLGVFGPPLKFDVSLPLPAISAFATDATELVAEHAPDAIPVLFGHVGEGNLHLNLVRCNLDADREHRLYSAMMELIARLGGNVSSEHGVGTRKRDYLGMSRTEADIAAMRMVKNAFDPTGYLNPAVLFG